LGALSIQRLAFRIEKGTVFSFINAHQLRFLRSPLENKPHPARIPLLVMFHGGDETVGRKLSIGKSIPVRSKERFTPLPVIGVRDAECTTETERLNDSPRDRIAVSDRSKSRNRFKGMREGVAQIQV